MYKASSRPRHLSLLQRRHEPDRQPRLVKSRLPRHDPLTRKRQWPAKPGAVSPPPNWYLLNQFEGPGIDSPGSRPRRSGCAQKSGLPAKEKKATALSRTVGLFLRSNVQNFVIAGRGRVTSSAWARAKARRGQKSSPRAGADPTSKRACSPCLRSCRCPARLATMTGLAVPRRAPRHCPKTPDAHLQASRQKRWLQIHCERTKPPAVPPHESFCSKTIVDRTSTSPFGSYPRCSSFRRPPISTAFILLIMCGAFPSPALRFDPVQRF